MKTCRKYLTHVQKSVFEGEITEGQVVKLRTEVGNIIHQKEDFVILYSLPDGVKIKRDILTNTPDPTDNFI
jgi:CRISPR-associated protein Cas2